MQTQDGPPPPAPPSVRRMDGEQAQRLAALSAAHDDLQHVLRCCEHLVQHLVGRLAAPGGRPESDPAVVEALWTSALLGYARCFAEPDAALSRDDLGELGLPGDVAAVHDLLLGLREHYSSPVQNPRERLTVGAAEGDDGSAVGVAVVSVPQPQVDEAAVRHLGALAYRLGRLLEQRMEQQQELVLAAARGLDREAFAALPVLRLDG